MKSSIKKKTWKAIYRLLDRVSPVNYDCGRLCGSACCLAGITDGSGAASGGPAAGITDEPGVASDGPEMGIYLYPGEEKLLADGGDWLAWSAEAAKDYDFPDSWHGKVYFVKCLTPPHCPRNLRPLQCRTFPLAPHITEDGVLTLIYNDEALPYRCPLIYGDYTLDERFYRATYTVWTHLLRDPLIFDLVEADSRKRW